jgi:hypothetical protein
MLTNKKSIIMKKNYTFFFILCSFFSLNLQGQVIYPLTTYDDFYNPGDPNLVVFDDIGFKASMIGANNSLALKKIKVVIDRDVNAPITDVSIWIGMLDNAGDMVATALGTVTLPLGGATTQLLGLTAGNGVDVLENITLNKDVSGDGLFFVGVQFSNPSDLNAWAIYTPPVPPNFSLRSAYVYDETTGIGNFFQFANVTDPDATFGVEITGSFITLPVEMTSFTGEPTGLEQCTLNWTTASEKNNSGYDVEKSFDGKTFSKIDFVKGAGNSFVKQKYEYTDNVFTQNAYYRLKQNDNDGQFSYSKVIFIETDKKGKVKIAVYPNPNKGIFTIDHTSETEDISITNAIGQVVYNNKVKESNRMEVDISNLPSGLYQVRLMGKNNYREAYPIQLTGQ